jgi:hypothetical protein
VRRRRDLVAILSVVAAMAFLVQGPSDNPTSHHALVRSLAAGTPKIDETMKQVGNVATQDVSWYDGHWYSNKAPGLAFVTLPAYLALEAAGLADRPDPSLVLWALGLVGLAIPAALIMLGVRSLGDSLASGLGTPAAIALGLGTLLLPFATMLFSHLLSTAFAFGAFYVLWREREGPERLPLLALAGVLCAFAATAEHPTALAGFVLAAYAAARPGLLRRFAVFTAGVAVGLVPLVAYAWWALGSPFRLPYAYTVYEFGKSGHDVLMNDLPLTFIFHWPSLSQTNLLFFWWWGFVTSAPILLLAGVGVWLLWQGGRRAEALTIAAIAVGFVLYDAAYYSPYGATWAPRYLIPTLPFLAVALAPALRRFPLVGVALMIPSIAISVTETITHPLTAWDGHVIHRLFTPAEHTRTALEFVGYVSDYDTLPYFVAVTVAVGIAFGALLRAARPISRGAAAAAAATLGGWLVFAPTASSLIEDEPFGKIGTSLAVLALLALLVAVVGAIAYLAETRAHRTRALHPV